MTEKDRSKTRDPYRDGYEYESGRQQARSFERIVDQLRAGAERAKNQGQSAMNHPAMSREDRFFAPELEAAISAWVAVFLNNEDGHPNRIPAARIEAWLEKNRPGLSPTARKRIAKTCNPQNRKRGGLVRTKS